MAKVGSMGVGVGEGERGREKEEGKDWEELGAVGMVEMELGQI